MIIKGEWWDANPVDVLVESIRTGAAPNISDAYTIDGQPGDLYKCSSQGFTLLCLAISNLILPFAPN